MKPVVSIGIGLACGLTAFAATSVLASDSAPVAPEATLYGAVLPLQGEHIDLMFAGGDRARRPLAACSGTALARLKVIARRYGRDVTMVRGVAVLEESPPEAKDAAAGIRSAQDWLKATCGDPRVLEQATQLTGKLSHDLGMQMAPGPHPFSDLTAEQRRTALHEFQLAQSWRGIAAVQNVLRKDDSVPMPPGTQFSTTSR